MFLFKIAFRNVVKNRRRSIFTIITISIGMAAIVVASGFFDYCLWGLKESIIQSGVGHFQLYKKGFIKHKNESNYDYLIYDYKKIFRDIVKINGINTINPRLSFEGILSSRDKTAIIYGMGGWISEERGLLSFATLEKGRFIVENNSEILLGAGPASKAGVDVNDGCTITVNLKDGGLNAMDFEVCGIVRCQLEELENVYALANLEVVQQLLDLSNAIDTIVVMLNKTSELDKVEKEIKKICEKYDLEYRKWNELVPYYEGAKAYYSNNMRIAIFTILAIVLFSIMNTITISIYERVREIGTMRALGTNSSMVIGLFSRESLILGVAGCLAGIILGFLIALVINTSGGIPLPPPPGNARDYRGLIYIDILKVMKYFCYFSLTAFLGSIPPAFRIAKMSVADTLRWI